MGSPRASAILFLFVGAGTVVVFVGVQWIIAFHGFSANTHPFSYMILLLTLASFAFAGTYALHYLARKWLLWALSAEHLPTIRFFERLAPQFTRKVLSSLVGTSIALSTAVAANAAPVTALDAPASVERADQKVAPQQSATDHLSVPNAQWFPEQVSVPMNNLVSQKTQPKRVSPKTGTEVVVAQGDSLWSICARHLGMQATAEEIATYWPQIYKANEKSIGPNPNDLQIGTVIELPPLP